MVVTALLIFDTLNQSTGSYNSHTDLDLQKITIVLVYTFSVVHKLNTTFVSKESPANRFLKQILPAAYSWKYTPKVLPYIVLSSYLLQIYFVISQNTSGYLLGGFCIHLMFGITGNSHFSILMYLLLLSTSSGAVNELPLATLLIVSAAIFLVFSRTIRKFSTSYTNKSGYYFMLCAFCIASSSICISGIFQWDRPPIHFGRSQIDYVSVVYVLVFSTIALAPYFSAKTEFSLAMFSGLDPSRNNHFLLPLRTDQFDDRYCSLNSVQMDKSAESHKSRNLRKAALLLQQYHSFRYSNYFLRESLRLFKKHNISLDILPRKDLPKAKTYCNITPPALRDNSTYMG